MHVLRCELLTCEIQLPTAISARGKPYRGHGTRLPIVEHLEPCDITAAKAVIRHTESRWAPSDCGERDTSTHHRNHSASLLAHDTRLFVA